MGTADGSLTGSKASVTWWTSMAWMLHGIECLTRDTEVPREKRLVLASRRSECFKDPTERASTEKLVHSNAGVRWSRVVWRTESISDNQNKRVLIEIETESGSCITALLREKRGNTVNTVKVWSLRHHTFSFSEHAVANTEGIVLLFYRKKAHPQGRVRWGRHLRRACSPFL